MKIKKVLLSLSLVLLCFIISTNIKGQALEDSVFSLNVKDSFALKLVKLAWKNNPSFDILSNNTDIALMEAKKARWSWLSNLNASGNMNEFTIDPSSLDNGNGATNRNLFYPRYNFSVSIPFSMFFETPTNIKIAEEKVKIQHHLIEEKQMDIKKQVLTKYSDYLMYREQLKLQKKVTNNENSNYLIMEEKFKNENISLNKLNEAQKAYNQELFKELQLENQLHKAKLELESIVGMSLEEVMKNFKN